MLTAMLWCAIQVTAFACGAMIVYLAARRLHPRAGAAAAGGALAMVLLLTILVASPWPRWRFSITKAESNAPAATTAPTPIPDAAEERPIGKDRASTPPRVQLDSLRRVFWTALLDRLKNPRPAPDAKPQAAGWALAIACVFACGSLATVARLTWGIASVRSLARQSRFIGDEAVLNAIVGESCRGFHLQRPVTVRESEELATPATVGWRQPVVLLPAAWRTWSNDELRAAVAHELAHIAGRDYAAWLVARMAVVAHFYHPLVRWLASRLQLEQELAADMTAARLVGDAKQYLHSLAALALATPPHRIAGPARTLIPSRSLLVRRVEMLRTFGITRPRRKFLRYPTFAIMAALGVAAAGLRGAEGERQSESAPKPAAYDLVAEPAARLNLELIPPDSLYVVSARPAAIVAQKELRDLPKVFRDLTQVLAEAKLAPADVVEVMVNQYGKLEGASPNIGPLRQPVQAVAGAPQPPGDFSNVRFAIRFTTPAKQRQYREWAITKTKQPLKKLANAAIWEADGCRITELDALTLVVDQSETGKVAKFAPLKNPPPRWAVEWQKRKDVPIVAAVDVRSWLKVNGISNSVERWLPVGELSFQTFYPLMLYVDWAVAGVELKGKIAVTTIIQSDDKQKAERVRDTLQALLTMSRNMAGVYDMAQVPGGAQEEAATEIARYKKVAEIVGNLLDTAKLTVDDSRVNVSLQTKQSTEEILSLAKTMLPAVEEAKQAARQQQSMNNMKQLALAMLNYEAQYKAFPVAASYTHKNGKSTYPHSWRVDVLPFVEQQKLFDEYHFDEPWDSDANKKVMAQMPSVFRSPFDEPTSTNTSYFVITGPGTMFEGEMGTRMKQITDGTSRTILLVEANRSVPWTKPEDIPYTADKPLPKLGGWVPGEFLVAIADGSVRGVAADIEEKLLRAWITRAGRENEPNLPAPSGKR